MMELKFMASDEEYTALALRAYFREGTFRADRMKEALWGGFYGMLALLIFSRVFTDEYPAWWLYPIAFPFGALVTYWTFKDSVASRTQKNFRKQFAGKGPYEITYRVGDGKIHVLVDGVELIYPLSGVTWAGEDAEYLDVCLKDKAYHSIPISAFESEAQKRDFVEVLGAPELRDLSNDKTLTPVPEKGSIRDGLQMSALPWYVVSVAAALLGMALLVANSFMVSGAKDFLNPMSYMAFGMILLGLVLGIVLLARRK